MHNKEVLEKVKRCEDFAQVTVSIGLDLRTLSNLQNLAFSNLSASTPRSKHLLNNSHYQPPIFWIKTSILKVNQSAMAAKEMNCSTGDFPIFWIGLVHTFLLLHSFTNRQSKKQATPTMSDGSSRTTFRRCSSICSFLNSLHCSRSETIQEIQHRIQRPPLEASH